MTADRPAAGPDTPAAPTCPTCDEPMKVHPFGYPRWFCMSGHATGFTSQEIEEIRAKRLSDSRATAHRFNDGSMELPRATGNVFDIEARPTPADERGPESEET